MILKTMAARTLFSAVALSALAASANAFVLGFDPQIFINRAIDSPTVTVRYTGASAALVELRINGVSFGTRTVSNSKDSGETNFTISQGDLHPGDNDVEIRLFDRTGKLLGKDHTNFSTAPTTEAGPVFLSTPKTGDTVRGPIELKLGFDKELKDCYVSFFIDGSFKNMTNVPPFVYVWDTEKESNGWHELEAWAIDDSSNTNKTGKIRVFVNNPGGRTIRKGVPSNDLVPTANSANVTPITAGHSKLRPVLGGPFKPLKSGQVNVSPLPPTIKPEEIVSAPVSVKPMKSAESIAMGPRNLLPTGKRVYKAPSQVVASASAVKSASVVKADPNMHPGEIASITIHHDKPLTPAEGYRIGDAETTLVSPSTLVAVRTKPMRTIVSNSKTSAHLLKITKGSRLALPNMTEFDISLDSEFVDFHGVLPRVDDGVPMTPLRFLLEKKGGLVDWDNPTKTVFAKADGNDISIHIGDSFALLNRGNIKLEKASYLDRGRTIVPLSFVENACHVKIDYDKSSNHMLITSQP